MVFTPIHTFILLSATVLYSQQIVPSPITSHPSPDGVHLIEIKKGIDDSWNVYLSTKNEIKIILSDSVHHAPTVKWCDSNIFMIQTNCGSPCWGTWFYSVDAKSLSKLYMWSVAHHLATNRVAHLNEEGTELTISNIFTGDIIQKVKMPIGIFTSQAYIYKFSFQDRHTITYTHNKKFQIIHINP